MGVRLDEAEAWAFLAAAHTGIFTTLRRDGVPIALPMWFVAFDRAVYVKTLAASRKAARVGRDPRVGFLVETGLRWAELKAVHLTGRAVVVTDPAEEARVTAALDAKYGAFRTSRAVQPAVTRAHYERPAVTFRIVPDGRLLSWDNTKLRLGGGGGRR